MGDRIVEKAALVLAFAAAAHVFLFPKYAELLRIELPRFLDLALYLPAVVLGLRAWLRTRSFARSWPLL
ncbi:MAG TPA: hypothetical protein EYP56_04570, partial [Planctomycetaceae bacterium]|nr:hypothetical protein [Planctomycetaceae bacterium]